MTNPVRESVQAFIDDGLEHVDLNEDNYEDVADKIEEKEFGYVPWNWPPFPNADEIGEKDIIDFFMVGNAINFQFRDPETGEKYGHERNGQLHEGAFGMWAALHNAYEEDPSILNGERLAELDETDIEELFSADNDVELPQLEDRQTILNSIGEQLSQDYDGSFHNLVEQSDNRLYSNGNGLIDNITDFKAYNDNLSVDGHDIDFYKRAQLAVWMPLGHLEVAQTENPITVEDEENFEIAADYHFPNIFRHLGLHEYDEELANDIEAGNELKEGGRRETELRAAAVYHGRNLIDELNSRTDKDITAAGLDGALFTDYKDEAENEHDIHRVDHTIWY